MREKTGRRLDRFALVLAVAMIAAGCAAPPPAPAGEGVAVAVMERPSWRAPPEPGLFRITFDARRADEIRREAATNPASAGLDVYNGERWILEREAEKELKARGLCSGAVRLVQYLDEGDGRSGFSALLKCLPSMF